MFFNMLSSLVITFLPRSKSLLISWLQSPSGVIFLLLFFNFSFFIYIFIFVCTGYALLSCGFSLVVASGGLSLVVLPRLLLLQSTGSRVQAQHLWCMGMDALWHVGSSQTRDRTCVPCTERQILIHHTVRQVERPFYIAHIFNNKDNLYLKKKSFIMLA